MSKQRKKGTAFESAVVRWLQARLDDPRIERRALHGTRDMGDVYGLRGQAMSQGIVECKAVASWGPALLADWQRQTEDERDNADADFALLVVRTPGCGEGRTEAFGRTRTFVQVRDLLVMYGEPVGVETLDKAPFRAWVETTLERACELMEGEA